MLELQVTMMSMWWTTRDKVRDFLDDISGDDRGEVTAMTVLIVILSIAALGAGAVIATKIGNNAKKVPEP